MFDLDAARKAGYSDDVIAQGLAQAQGVDYSAAQKAGYTAADMLPSLIAENTPKPGVVDHGPGNDFIAPDVNPDVMANYKAPDVNPAAGASLDLGAGPVRQDYAAKAQDALESMPVSKVAAVAQGAGPDAAIARHDLPALVSRTEAVASGDMTPQSNRDMVDDALLNDVSVSNDQPTHGQRIEDYVRSLLGLSAASESPDEKARAQAFIMASAQRDGITVDDMRKAIGGMSPELDQFSRGALDAYTNGLVNDTSMPAEGLAQMSAKGLGNLAGFIAGPAKVAGKVMQGVAGEALIPTIEDSFGTRLAKSVVDQAATLGLATGVDSAGRALDTNNLGDAAGVLKDSVVSGEGMGSVFGAAGRIIPGSGIISKASRIAGINTAMDVLGGSNPLDDRPFDQKIFDYGLNTFFALHGGSPIAGHETKADPLTEATAVTNQPDLASSIKAANEVVNAPVNPASTADILQSIRPLDKMPAKVAVQPTIEQQFADIQAAKNGTPADTPEKFLSPRELELQDHAAKASAYGLTPDQTAAMAPAATMDHVTGFNRAEAKVPTVQRAIDYVNQTGNTAHFVEGDIANLGGLNAYFGNDHTQSNAVYRAMSDIFADEINKAGSQDATLIRHGGDEISAVVVGGTDESINAAMERARARVLDYAQQNGLADIPHPKHSGDASRNGVGLYMGQSDIVPKDSLDDIFSRAARGIDSAKKGEPYVGQIKSHEVGLGAPGGNPEAVREGSAAAGRGAKPADVSKPKGLEGEEGDSEKVAQHPFSSYLESVRKRWGMQGGKKIGSNKAELAELRLQHLDIIESALEAGRAVPREVLADHGNIDAKEYPLAAKLAAPPSEKSTPHKTPADAGVSTSSIADTIKSNVEALIKLKKNADQIKLVPQLEAVLAKAKAVLKSGTGKASDFAAAAKPFKGKDDKIYAALKSIENALEPARAVTSTTKKPQQAAQSLLPRLRQLGGVNLFHLKDITGESNVRKSGAVGIFSKNGRGLDDLATILADEGFPIDTSDVDGGVQQLRDHINDALHGNSVLTHAAMDAKMSADQEATHRDGINKQAKELGIKTVGRKFNDIEDEVLKRLTRQHSVESAELTDDEYNAADDAMMHYQDIFGEGAKDAIYKEVSEAYGDKSPKAFYTELTKRYEEATHEHETRSAGEAAGAVAGEPSESAQIRGAENGTGEDAGKFDLQGQSNAEIVEQERAAAQRARDEETHLKAVQADKDHADLTARKKAHAENPDNFQFGESSSDAVKPMGDLFSQSAIESKAESRLDKKIQKATDEYQSTDLTSLSELSPSELDIVKLELRAWLGDELIAKRIPSELEYKKLLDKVNSITSSLQPADEATKAKAALDNAGVKGSERIQTIAAVRRGEVTADEVAEAHGQPISDFGEKIAGAKKDLWQTYKKSMSDELPADAKDITLSKHFPEPDYEAMIANGTDIRAIAAIKAMRDEIPAKPKKSYKLKRWADDVRMLRKLANELIDRTYDTDIILQKMRSFGGLSKFVDRIEMYADLGYPAFKTAKGYEISGGWTRPNKSGEQFGLTDGKGRVSFYDSRQDAIDALRAKLETAPETTEGARSTKLDIYRVTKTGDIVIGKKVASNKYIDLKGGFTSARDAREYLAANEKSLLDLLEQRKEVAPERRSVNNPRVGEDYRQGEDVTPEKFASEFGFRGVQFGNYVEQGRRNKDLNNAYDALLDLAHTIDIPSRAVSLNGSLGLAFGARGSGGVHPASAHFEPDHVVINLTKTNGAGSLGHEWFHALDNYFSKMGGKDHKFVTDNPESFANSAIRPEALRAFSNLMQGIHGSDFEKRSMKLDTRRSKDYWSTDLELAARAFETYLVAKAEAKGESNDYLANIVSEEAHNILNEAGNEFMGAGEEPYPYPTKAEAKILNPLYDKLFETLKAKETDQGIALYQNKEQYNPNETSQKTTDIYAGRDTRPDTTDEQRRVGRDAYREVLGPYADRAGISLLGSRIAKDFKEQGGAPLIGQVAKTHEDLAVLAQILRDPRFETFRIFFTKGGVEKKAFQDYQRILRSWYGTDQDILDKAAKEELGKLESLGAAVINSEPKIVGQTGITSRLPGMVNIAAADQTLDDVIKYLSHQRDALKADGYWLLHNHPSGRALESDADMKLTQAINQRMEGFLGHVIIDHNEYTNIDKDGVARLYQKDLPHYFDKDNAEIPHDALNKTMLNSKEVANVGKMIQRKDGFFTLIGRSAQGEVAAIAEAPIALLQSGDANKLRLIATLRRFAVQTGSTNVFAVADGKTYQKLVPMVKSGLLMDAVVSDGYTSDGAPISARDSVTPNGDLFDGRNPKSIRVEQESTPYGSDKKDEAPAERGASLKDRIAKLIKAPAELLKTPMDALGTAVIPMAMGSDQAKVVATKFADRLRGAVQQWNKFDDVLQKRFTKDQQVKMWSAADEENDMLREGVVDPQRGLGTLNADERKTVELLHDYGNELLQRARDAGMYEGEGVDYWTPRMVVLIDENGKISTPQSGGMKDFSGEATNLRTQSKNLKGRKYDTTAEAEAAAQGLAGEGQRAEIVRNIRTMPMAMARLEQAIAGRELVNQIKAIGQATGHDIVAEGKAGNPDYFTIDHPALALSKPRMTEITVSESELTKRNIIIRDGQAIKFTERGDKVLSGYTVNGDGTVTQRVPLVDTDGNPIIDRTPLYIRKDFEGPVKAVLNAKHSLTPVYNGLMEVKSKSMGLIMMSPMIHNAVEYGRSVPMMLTGVGVKNAGKNVLTLGAYTYLVGNRAKNDVATMREAISHGLVPIGHRGAYVDIHGIAAPDTMEVGKSWTAKALGAAVDVISEPAGDKVRAEIDAAGKFWHETLLWDRVGDLQMGLYQTMKTSLINKGVDDYTAATLAAHFANRYAGSLPNEAMSQGAREVLNLALFSRTFTLGNLGAMKDILSGLPTNRKAMIEMNAREVAAKLGKNVDEAGDNARKQATSIARRKAMATFILDVGLMYVANSLVQDWIKRHNGDEDWQGQVSAYAGRLGDLKDRFLNDPLSVLTHPFNSIESLSATSLNAPGKEKRINMGDDSAGNTIYMRLPFGKIGEEFSNYTTLGGALTMLHNKLSPQLKPFVDAYNNDAGAGQKVYDDSKDASLFKQAGQFTVHFLKSQVPWDMGKSVVNLATGKGSEADKSMDQRKLLGPLVGLTYNKVTGGDALATAYQSMRDYHSRLVNAMPDVKDAMAEGDEDKARQILEDIGMTPHEINRTISGVEDPSSRLSPGLLKQFRKHATDDEKKRLDEIRR